jgi:hypothetical protein
MIDGFYTPQSRSKSTGGATKRDVSVWQKQQAADVTPAPRPTYYTQAGKYPIIIDDAKPYVPVGMSSEQQHIAQSNFGATDANTILVPNPAERSTAGVYGAAYEDYTRRGDPWMMEGLGIRVASPSWTQSLVSGVVNGTVHSPLPDGFIGPPGPSTALDPLVPGWGAYSDDYAARTESAMPNIRDCCPCSMGSKISFGEWLVKHGIGCGLYYFEVGAQTWMGPGETAGGAGAYDTPIECEWCE